MPFRSTEQDYRARVARVVAAIVADPPAEHRLEDLAAIAHFSPFHFHRVYASVVGETVSSTIRRVRLARAASLLAQGGESITQVGQSVGYDSPQAFSRAFGQFAGQSPRAFQQRLHSPANVGHHDTAEALADAGFVVAAISHPGDNFQDLSRQQHLSAFATRPVDLRRLVDFMTSSWAGRTSVDANRVGAFGFSRGGYTGLVAIGAVPDFALRQELCPAGSTLPMCSEFLRGDIPPPPMHDPRIKAAVIVDPLSVFDAAGLKNVSVPVQLWSSEFGGDGVTPASVVAVRRDLPAAPDWQLVVGAGHFAFLAPCPPKMANALPELCRDKAGFDRVAFHARFNAEVVAFFMAHLPPD